MEHPAPLINHFTSFSRESPATIKVKTSEAKRTLNQWKETYFETRAKIEASGRDARWEFDRKRLFERTDYMATICEDIHEVAQVSCKMFLRNPKVF
jgi:dynein heavy chain